MNKFAGFMLFVIGAAVGSVATWQFVKNKYEQIAQEEIDSVKEVFSKREVSNNDEEKTVETKKARIIAEQAIDKPRVAEYAKKLHDQGYTNYSKDSSVKNNTNNNEKVVKEEEEPMTMDKPYVIPPDDFGDMDEYEQISLTYYSDGILTDDDDVPITDVDEVVGSESLETFGEYEDDSVFVRNDKLKCDYEILLDQRKYSDVVNRKPHEVDD